MRMAMMVSENVFSTLHVQPMLGRAFTPQEGRVPGSDAVVVLGYDFWKNVLGADPSILSRLVVINGIDFNVIGVAPESFTGMDQFVRPELYVPLMMQQWLVSGQENPLEDRKARTLEIKGRLRPGVSRRSADSEMATLWKGLEDQYPDANRNRTMSIRTELEQRVLTMRANAILTVMMTSLAALVLIIACANVANLMLGRARARSREIAIRLALGVSRVRLLRQLLTESLLIALSGGTLGLGIAYAGIRFLATAAQAVVPTEIPVVVAPRLDYRVLVFSFFAAVVSAVLCGVAPAWQSLKIQLVTSLKGSDLGDTARRRMIGRNALVVAQLALSMVLLVATGMLLAGFRNTLELDPGFRKDHLITMALDTSFTRYTPAQTHEFYRNLVDRARVLPGVRSVTLADAIPLARGFASRRPIIPEGYQFPQGQETAAIATAVVDENYFDTMKTRIVQGRSFTLDDNEGSSRVAIINDIFAATYWPNQGAIGKRLRLNNNGPWLEVVGLAKSEKYSNILEPPTPFLYLPFRQQEKPQMSVLIETVNADASPLAGPLRDVVRTLDANQPVFSLRTFSSYYEREATGPQLLVLRTATGIGLLGLTLALVGLYGLIVYSVARRTREIGIRMAIGAGRANVLTMVLRQGMALALAGILVGSIASIAVTHLLTAAVVGLAVPNAATYVVVPMLLIGLTLAASYVPARRASNVDPLRALRYE
jgi:putative ABC transport system permease protein